MTCAEFQDRFSDYFDGTGEPRFMAGASAHLDGCVECRRYQEVVEQGVQILRAAPGPSVAEDFFPRLQHRIYHLEDGPALSRSETAGSAATTTAALVIAMLVAAAAWSPVLVQAPEVAIDPIVVSRPEARVVGIRTPQYRTLRVVEPASVVHRGLWDDPLLLTRYSPLTAARARSALRQADLE